LCHLVASPSSASYWQICYFLVILRCASFTQVVTFFWNTAPNYFTVYAPVPTSTSTEICPNFASDLIFPLKRLKNGRKFRKKYILLHWNLYVTIFCFCLHCRVIRLARAFTTDEGAVVNSSFSANKSSKIFRNPISTWHLETCCVGQKNEWGKVR
jgi:hypothetical protein